MSATQLSFSLRVTPGVKTVHLLGSWDNYAGQLPLSKPKDKTSKSLTYKGTFRFQTSVLQPGQRYWYYYIVDGYHCSHNPSEPSTVETTSGRSLNILDVSGDKAQSSKYSKSTSKSSSSSTSKRSSRVRASLSVDIPKGRPLSSSQIKAPQPMSPHATRHILAAEYEDEVALEELSAQMGAVEMVDDEAVLDYEYFNGDDSVFSGSPVSSSGSSLSSLSDSSSPSSGYSTPNSDCSNCTCERYGITRKGERVRIDCGGSRCGVSDSESCSSSSDSEGEAAKTSSRRRGMVVRS